MDEERRPLLPPGYAPHVVLSAAFALACAALAAMTLGPPPAKRLPAHSPAEFPGVFRDDPLLGLADPRPGTFPVPPPPFSEGMFPCSSCHADLKTDPRPRALEMAHEEIAIRHGDRSRWCFDCHHPDDRDRLRLASGAKVEFAESYRLCAQCHGPTFRDWEAGVHGRRSGYWDGPKRYLLCAHCHDPHAPRFKPIRPLPPPATPGRRP